MTTFRRLRETLPRYACGYPAAVVVLTAHFFVAVTSVLEKSNAYDEIAHITAGFNYWTENDYRLHPENGNLPQRWFALPLLTGEFRCPKFEGRWDRSDIWEIGNQFFFRDGNCMESMLWRARAMNALVSVGLGFLVYGWSRRLFGPGGGMLSLLCYAMSPTILANGSLATSDLAAAAFFTLSVGCLWQLFHNISPRNIIFAWLGLAGLFLSKMSAGLIVPMGAALLVIRLLGGRPLSVLGREIAGNRKLAQVGAICGIMLIQAVLVVATIWAFYGFRYSAFAEPRSGYESFYASEKVQPGSDLFGGMTAFAETHRLLPESYLYGTLFVYRHAQNREAFLNGQYSATGWWYFFPYALLVKTPLWFFLLLIVAGGGAIQSWRLISLAGFNGSAPRWSAPQPTESTQPSRAPPSGRSAKSARRSAKAAATPPAMKTSTPATADRPHPFCQAVWEAFYATAPLWVLLSLYWTTAIYSNLNIGHRHLLPTYPAMFILAGAAARWFEWRNRLGRLVSVVVVICTIGLIEDCYGIYPHYLAYFNCIAGGPNNAYKHLVDSSLDWGQDLPGLKRWLADNGLDNQSDTPVYLAYVGTSSPAYYGIQAGNLKEAERLGRLGAGVYCISATFLQLDRVSYLNLSHGRPGNWGVEDEKDYQQALGFVGRQCDEASEIRDKAIQSQGQKKWEGMVNSFKILSCGRLCAYLRSRPPDDNVAHSILIFRLSAKEIDDALFGPPVFESARQ